MGKHGRVQGWHVEVLSLGPIAIEIGWQTDPDQDVLARLLLELIGEETLKEVFDE